MEVRMLSFIKEVRGFFMKERERTSDRDYHAELDGIIINLNKLANYIEKSEKAAELKEKRLSLSKLIGFKIREAA